MRTAFTGFIPFVPSALIQFPGDATFSTKPNKENAMGTSKGLYSFHFFKATPNPITTSIITVTFNAVI